jgi:beta-glucosidase
MKNRFLTYAICALVSSCLLFTSCDSKKGKTESSTAVDSIDIKVKDLLSKMTLEEKVGQMTQVNLNMILSNGYGPPGDSIQMDTLRKVLQTKNIGSFLNCIDHAYTVEKWHEIITKIQDVATKETRLKIPVIYGIDAIHGVTFTRDATLFPHNLALAAGRNPELVQKAEAITAMETRASGIRWNFDPVLDVGRQPLWSRFGETFGEDVLLTKVMGVATIKGQQGENVNTPTTVAACMKHFLGYSAPQSGKDRTPSIIPEQVLREIFLPPFKAAVDAGVKTVMINSGEINGIPVHSSKYLLTDVLRGELGFKGVAVTDWEDVIRLHTRHKIAANLKEAVKIAVDAGIDMSMVPHDYSFYYLLIELVNEKQVSMERIDQSVARILRLKFELGLFDNPYPEKGVEANFGKPEYKQVALEAAREAITLLKNEGDILPLNKEKKALVTGPGANSITTLNGCWSYTWQGNASDWYPKEAKTIVQAVKDKIGEKNVVYAEGSTFTEAKDIQAAVRAAKGVDYILLCIGEDAYAEQPGVIDELDLPDAQLELAKALYATGKPVILVLTEGRPRIFRKIEPHAKGVVLAYWPGVQGGPAIADVLYGDVNPSGKLPFSYPRYSGNLIPYDCKFTDIRQELIPGVETNTGYNPQYPFGFGLSYTKFGYSNLTLDSAQFSGDSKVTVSVTVKNTGTLAGKEVVHLYSRDLFATITPQVKRLRGFQKILLQPGQEQKVQFVLDKSDLSFVNNELKTVIEPGEFELAVDTLKASLIYK